MAVFTTKPPDFRFSGLYYPQIWQALLNYRRAYMPELSDENPNEPTIQILNAFAAGFHYANVLLDHVAVETLMSTSRLRESLKAHLALIGYHLKEATPAVATVLARLASPLTSNATVPALSTVTTRATAAAPRVAYETLAPVFVTRTDYFTGAFEYKATGPTFTDVLAVTQGVGTEALWGGNAEANDALYLGHDSVIYSGVRLAFSSNGNLFVDENRWVLEYYDESDADTTPAAVSLAGPTLVFDLTTLLGTNDRSGTEVTIRCNLNGMTQVVVSSIDSGVNIATAGVFGQPAPSEVAGDYIVGTHWKEVPNAVLTVKNPGFVLTYDAPESLTRTWARVMIEGIYAYWVRLRSISSYTAPTLAGETKPTAGAQYLKLEVVQGTTYEDSALAFDGSENQRFQTSRDSVIDSTVRCFVDEGGGEQEYTVVADFLSSSRASRHFVVAYDEDSNAIVQFGDGTNGRKPLLGSSLRILFRVDAKTDGNVGPNQIIVNQSSASFIAGVSNPRPATGWSPPEGSTPESRAEAKIAGPASIRIRERAVTTDDVSELAIAHIFSGGSRLVERALATADGWGEKTFSLVVVGLGGSQLSAAALEELRTYFCGDEVVGTAGVLMAGYSLVPVNYVGVPVDVTVTIHGGDYQKASAALASYLSPTAVNAAGNYVHGLNGSTVYKNNLYSVVSTSDASIVYVSTIYTPAGDVVLAPGEIPVPGMISVSVA